MVREIKRRWFLLVLITAVGFFMDWLTKYLAETHLVYGSPVRIAGNYIQLLLVYNKGALFGFNPRSFVASFPVNQFFIVFTILAVVMLILYYRTLPKTEITLHWGIMMILPGAFGNFLDRIIHPAKGVVDFIRLGVSDILYWPIFNLADVYVTIGIALLIYSFITEEKRKKLAVIEAKSDTATEEKSELTAQENSVSTDVK